jgi:hypothetical protein
LPLHKDFEGWNFIPKVGYCLFIARYSCFFGRRISITAHRRLLTSSMLPEFLHSELNLIWSFFDGDLHFYCMNPIFLLYFEPIKSIIFRFKANNA